jgi:hypothetical protein
MSPRGGVSAALAGDNWYKLLKYELLAMTSSVKQPTNYILNELGRKDLRLALA